MDQTPTPVASRTFSDSDRARAKPPTREQLVNLIKTAERRLLTPAEAYLLRAGVTRLAAQLGGAGGRIRKLTAEVEQARQERDAAVRELALSGPQAVGCPFCGASAGESCRSAVGGEPLQQPHAARLDAVRRVVGSAPGGAS